MNQTCLKCKTRNHSPFYNYHNIGFGNAYFYPLQIHNLSLTNIIQLIATFLNIQFDGNQQF